MTTVSLNGIDLNPDLQWVDKRRFSSVAQSVRTTLSGNPVVQSFPTKKGRPITLVATEEFGWLTKTQVDSLQSIANDAGGVYTLVVGLETYQVMFRHHEPPAFEAEAFVPRHEEGAGDYFLATIRLMTV